MKNINWNTIVKVLKFLATVITITHDAHSRQGFALGAVLAAEYTKEHQGLLTISDMFKF